LACCGRPFVVAGSAEVAEVVEQQGWSELSLGLDVDEATRPAVVAGWLRDARMEHASIASFARFVMDLVALGAPADLVHDAGVALLDEVEHARLCFSVAAHFGGKAFGPASFDAAAAASPARDFEQILRSVVMEGCVGETVAAYVASQRLASASDPVARAALTRIAEDETRHAELAFRFVAWARASRPETALAIVDAAFEAALGDSEVATEELDCGEIDPRVLAAAGLMGASDERRAIREALVGVVRPVADALRARALTSALPR
jgi:hypothetical protein